MFPISIKLDGKVYISVLAELKQIIMYTLKYKVLWSSESVSQNCGIENIETFGNFHARKLNKSFFVGADKGCEW